MESTKVAINGFGTIGKRVADAVDAQDDMEVVGVTKTGPSFGCELAIKKGFPLYCTFDDRDRISLFEKKGTIVLEGFPICFRLRMWLLIALLVNWVLRT